MKDEDRIPEGYELAPGAELNINRHPEGMNRGDWNDPKASDSVMFSAPDSQYGGPPQMRMSLLRGKKELGHLTLTLEGMEGLMFQLASTIEKVKERFGVTKGGGLN